MLEKLQRCPTVLEKQKQIVQHLIPLINCNEVHGKIKWQM